MAYIFLHVLFTVMSINISSDALEIQIASHTSYKIDCGSIVRQFVPLLSRVLLRKTGADGDINA